MCPMQTNKTITIVVKVVAKSSYFLSINDVDFFEKENVSFFLVQALVQINLSLKESFSNKVIFHVHVQAIINPSLTMTVETGDDRIL